MAIFPLSERNFSLPWAVFFVVNPAGDEIDAGAVCGVDKMEHPERRVNANKQVPTVLGWLVLTCARIVYSPWPAIGRIFCGGVSAGVAESTGMKAAGTSLEEL